MLQWHPKSPSKKSEQLPFNKVQQFYKLNEKDKVVLHACNKQPQQEGLEPEDKPF